MSTFPESAGGAPFTNSVISTAVTSLHGRQDEGSKQDISSTPAVNATVGARSTSKGSTTWEPKELSKPWLVLLLIFQTTIIASIAALLTFSNSNSGFAPVIDVPPFLADHPDLSKALWTSGFLWTFFPTLVMTIYGMMWSSVVDASVDRQPFVSLYILRLLPSWPHLTEAKVGARLDYGRCSQFLNWCYAIGNGHCVLAVAMLLTLGWNLLGVPLTSFLFTDAPFIFNSTDEGTWTKDFDATAFDVNTDLRQVMQIVAATQIYGGNQPLWTFGEFAFAPLSPPPASIDAPMNLTTSALGYSGVLDCRIVPDSDYSINLTTNQFGISATDRGCEIKYDRLSRQSPYPMFLVTWSTMTCGLSAGRSRLSVVAGVNAASADGQALPSNLSLISCIPSYWVTSGNLTITFGLSGSPGFAVINDFQPESSVQRGMETWYVFEPDLHIFTGFSPSAQVDAGDFGQTIYSLSRKVNPASPLDPTTIMDATSTLFSSIFAILAVMFLFRDSPSPTPTPCVWSVSVTRLVVVLPIACILLAIVGFMVFETLALFIYCSKNPSILSEEPVGLMGYSEILKEERLATFLEGLARKDNQVAECPYWGKLPTSASSHNQLAEFDDAVSKIESLLRRLKRESAATTNLRGRIRRCDNQRTPTTPTGSPCDSDPISTTLKDIIVEVDELAKIYSSIATETQQNNGGRPNATSISHSFPASEPTSISNPPTASVV